MGNKYQGAFNVGVNADVRRYDIIKCSLFKSSTECICEIDIPAQPEFGFAKHNITILYPESADGYIIRNISMAILPEQVIEIIGNSKEDISLRDKWFSA